MPAPKPTVPEPAAVLESPPAPRLTGPELAAEYRQTDHLLTALLVVLAFLLAAFPIVDSRVWQSLRTGQLIETGQFQFGADPFCYTTAGQTWVHPGWLADYSFYRIFQTFGGAGLVLLRALLFTLLTLLILSFQRDKQLGLWGLATGLLAVLAIAPRLWVRPELFSLLFTGLSLYLLARPAEANPKGWLAPMLRLTRGRYWVFLPPLFALWANLDEWFILGPFMVLLWWLGGLLEVVIQPDESRRMLRNGESRPLLIVLLVGMLACCLNPYHVQVFQLPAELYSQGLAVLSKNFAARKISVSPFSGEWFGAHSVLIRPLGLTLCDWAYYPLVALGLLSFAVAGNWRSSPRLLLWAAFFVLSAWQARNIGFFAIVAGPLTLMNLGEWCVAVEPGVSRLQVAGRLLLRFGLLIFLVLGGALAVLPFLGAPSQLVVGEPILGWLNPRGTLGFSIYADPSMQAVAEWRQRRRPAGNVFYMNFAEPGGYEAWFNPGGRNFVDFRYRLHGTSAAEFWDAYEALRETGQANRDAHELLERWQRVFKKYNISHVVVSNRAVLRADGTGKSKEIPLPSLLRALTDKHHKLQFELLEFIDGQHFVLAWTGSPRHEAIKKLRFNDNQEVFRQPLRVAVPPSEPPPLAQPSPLGLYLDGSLSRRPNDLDGASWYLGEFATQMQQMSQLNFQAPIATALYWGGQMATATPLLAMPVSADVLCFDATSPARLYLAIRAARRAIAAAPHRHDADARGFRSDGYRSLHQAYDRLAEMERRWTQGMPLQHRQFQALSALRMAAENSPGNPDYRDVLGERYLARRGVSGQPEPFVDEALFHFEAALALYKVLGQMGPRPATSSEMEIEYKRLLAKRLNFKLEDLQKDVDRRQAAFRQRAPLVEGGPTCERLMQRAAVALQLGLVRQAEIELREALAIASPEQLRFVAPQAAEVYFGLGLLPDLLDLLNRPNSEALLGTTRFHLLGALAAAAAGDFDTAVRHQDAQLRLARDEAGRNLVRAGQVQVLGAFLEPAGSSFAANQLLLDQNMTNSQQLAELELVRGLYLLEGGQPQVAAASLAKSATNYDPLSPLAALSRRMYFLITNEFLRDSLP